MLLDKFTTEIPDNLKDLHLTNYIKLHFNFYKVNEVEDTCKIILKNLINRNYYNKKNSIYKYLCIYLTPSKYPLHKISYTNMYNAIKVLEKLEIIRIEKGKSWFDCFINSDDSKKIDWKKSETKKALMTKVYFNEKVEIWSHLANKLNMSCLDLAKIIFKGKSHKHSAVISKKRIEKKTFWNKKTSRRKTRKVVTVLKRKASKPERDRMDKINSVLVENGLESFQYQRIFSENELSGGRLHSSFQRIPKSFRKKICEEQDWIELDYTSFNPNALYTYSIGEVYKDFFGDFYAKILDVMKIPVFVEERELIKKAVVIALGSKNKTIATNALRKHLFDENLFSKKYGYFYVNDTKIIFSPEYILDILENNLSFSEFFYCSSHSLTQFLESNIILNNISNMLDDNIIPLTVHDCIIVPSCDKEKYEKIIEDNFKNTIIKIKSFFDEKDKIKNECKRILNNKFKFNFNWMSDNFILKYNRVQIGTKSLKIFVRNSYDTS